MYNRQFRAGLWRLAASLALAVALSPAGLGAGCARQQSGLSREDQRLVRQLVDQALARLARARADSTRAGAGAMDSAAVGLELQDLPRAWLDSAGVEQRLAGPWETLWKDPERGRRVLQAVHDSLEALRPVLFPPAPRPVPPPRPRVP